MQSLDQQHTKGNKMNSIAHMTAGVCFLIIGALFGFLAVINGALVAGAVAFLTFLIIAVAFFKKSETLGTEECLGRRLYKGNFN